MFLLPQLPPAPPGWTLQERAGDTRLVLARRDGRERVTVELAVDDQGDEEGDDDDAFGDDDDDAAADDAGVVFAATIAKDGAPYRLVAECRSDGSYLQILHAALESSSPLSDDAGADDAADEALGGAVAALAAAKEQAEYVGWLEKLKAFVAA